MQKPTLFSKDFTLVAVGQIISLFGNQILRYALPLYLLNQTGSSALFGTISACAFLPMLLLYPIGGILADRVNKRNIMVILDFCTAGLTLLFSLLMGLASLVPLMAVTMMALYGIQGAYQPAVKASVPILVSSKNLMQANSVIDVISSLAGMIGPVIGGILLSVTGLTPILYVSAGCFFLSAVMELFIRIPFEKKKSSGGLLAGGYGDLKESFQFVFRKQPALWKMAIVYAASNLLLSSLVLIAVPVIVTQRLGFSADTANRLYGYAQGVIAVGCIVGGLLAGILSKKLKPKAAPYLLAGSALAMGLGGLALQVMHAPIAVYLVLTVSCGLMLMLSSLFQIQMMSYVQILTPHALIGKVISCVICICMFANPLGGFLYGLVFEKLQSGVYLPFYAAAALVLGISLFTRRLFAGIGQQLEQAQETV